MDESKIQKFYKSCNVFITGGTGLIGKILIEKLLRSTEVSTVYVLIREKRGKSVHRRIDELFNCVIFDIFCSRQKKECPEFNHRIEVVPGDCAVTGLGLNITDKQKLINDVHVVFNVAATVKFDENLKLAYAINVNGAKEVLDLAGQMKNLKSMIHVSTAYSNCHLSAIEEKFYEYPLKHEDIGKMLEKVSKNEAEQLTPRIIDPWPNTYTFTKALAESMIKDRAFGLPLGIFTPAIVTSTYKKPIEGCIDNFHGASGLVAGTISGVIRVLPCKIESVAEIVPVDTCVAGIIASAWDVSNSNFEMTTYSMPIYNYVSSVENPVIWNEFIELGLIQAYKNPVSNSLWAIFLLVTTNIRVYEILKLLLHIFPALLLDVGAVMIGQKPRMMQLYQKVHRGIDALTYFTLGNWKFSNNNTVNLWSKMNMRDRELFPLSTTTVHWSIYFKNYIKGIRLYLLNDPQSTLDVARKRYRRLTILHVAVKMLLVFVICNMISLICSKMYNICF